MASVLKGVGGLYAEPGPFWKVLGVRIQNPGHRMKQRVRTQNVPGFRTRRHVFNSVSYFLIVLCLIVLFSCLLVFVSYCKARSHGWELYASHDFFFAIQGGGFLVFLIIFEIRAICVFIRWRPC